MLLLIIKIKTISDVINLVSGEVKTKVSGLPIYFLNDLASKAEHFSLLAHFLREGAKMSYTCTTTGHT